MVGLNGEKFPFWVTTEEKRVDTSVTTDKIRYLFKFQNDMDDKIVYAYPYLLTTDPFFQEVNRRHTKVYFEWTNLANDFTTLGLYSKVNLRPAGYWYYWVYEVVYNGTNNAPTTVIQTQSEQCDCCDLPLDENCNYCWSDKELEGSGYEACGGCGGYGEGINPASCPVLVEEGKMLISERNNADGDDSEVQYIDHPEPSGTNYIYVK